MDKRTRQFNEELASLIGIQNIELQYSINRISREAMGIVSRRMRFAISHEQINQAYAVKYNIDIIYSEIQTFVEKKSERLMELYLRNLGVIITSTLEKYSMLEARKTINKTFFPGVPKEQILRIIRGESIGKRILAKMAKSGMSPTVLSSLAMIQNDPMKRQRILSDYFVRMRNNAYTIARTAISGMAGKTGKAAYEALPRDLIGFQVHGILDDRIRPAHRARNGTIYYKKPQYENPGLDQMPNPPLEADGSIAYNCRCWLTPVMALDSNKFYDFKGRLIPNAKIFDEWFSTSSKDRQILAIGVRRYSAAVKRLKKGEKLKWEQLLDPVTGMLLDEKSIKAESPQKRTARIKKAKKIIIGT